MLWARYCADGRVTCCDHRAARPPGTFTTPTALQQTFSFQPTQDLAAPRPPSTIVAPRQEPNFSSTAVSATLRRKSTTRRSRPSNSTRHTRDLLVDIAQQALPTPTLRVSSFLWPPEGIVGCYICCHHWTTLSPTTPAHVEVSQPNASKVSTVHLPVAAIKQLFLVPGNAQLSKPAPDIPWFSPSADTSAHFSTSAPLRISVRAIHLPTSATERSRGCWLGYPNSKAPRREISSAKRRCHFGLHVSHTSDHQSNSCPPCSLLSDALLSTHLHTAIAHPSPASIRRTLSNTAHRWTSNEIFHPRVHSLQPPKPPTDSRRKNISTLHCTHPNRHPPTPHHQK